MKTKRLRKFYLLACLGGLVASFYPLYMGIRVIGEMLSDGTVLKENYPKYIIPYTPISVAILLGVLILPLCMKIFRRFALVGGSAVSVGTFFAMEMLFEKRVVVTTPETVVRLEDWQMFMCAVPPGGWSETVTTTYKKQTAVDILMGNYNPAFKLHFYLISVVLILSILNSLYGFARLIETGEKKRLKSLVLQSACSFVFLGLCILACFTAFWRDGSQRVSPLSAVLMAVFFLLFGLTAGIYAASFLLGRRRFISIGIPVMVALTMTGLMYVGEMILLHGHLYSFGIGFLFDSIPGIVLAPIDLLIVAAAGGVAALAGMLLNRKK